MTAQCTICSAPLRHVNDTGICAACILTALNGDLDCEGWNPAEAWSRSRAGRDIPSTPPRAPGHADFCPGCGYFRAMNGDHRDDCTATQSRNLFYPEECVRLGRCQDCGFHPPTQGHRDTCPATQTTASQGAWPEERNSNE
jgi:hypothetical protein